MSEDTERNAYWSANIRIVVFCLVIWFLVSFGAGILFRPFLEGIEYGGAGLHFWFAQQGSIIVFLFLIFFYSFWMNSVDKKYGVDEE